MIDQSSSTLEDVVGVWDGSRVFAETVPPIRNLPAPPSLGMAPEDSPSTPPAPQPSGSASSPISIHSTPSPLHRPRGKAICTHLAAQAFNAPRPVRPLVTFAEPPTTTTSNRDIPIPKPKPTHPFFSRPIHRTQSAPLRAPKPHRPRLVAHYSSTSQSTQASLDRPRQRDVWRVDGHEIELTQYTIPARDSDEQSEEEETVEMPIAQDDIKRLADALESMVLPRSNPAPVVVPKARPTYKGKGKMKNPGLPEYDHTTFSPVPKVAYTTNADEANDLLSCLKGQVFGFDMEWPTTGQSDLKGRVIGRRWNEERKRYEFYQPKTALLQFCDKEMIVMVHIWHMDRIPEKAVEILADPNVYKTGVAISNDGKKLLRDYPHAFPNGIASLLELSNVARRVDPINTGPGKNLIALAKLVATYLGKYLDKSRDLRAGNWTLPLSEAAAAYAANDVHAGLYLYHALCDIGHESDIDVDLAELALHLPGAGQRVWRSSEAAVPDNKLDSLVLSKPIKDDKGKTLVSPAKIRAIEMYKSGLTTMAIAEDRNVQVTTIQGYILDALKHLPSDALDVSDKKRLLDELEPNGNNLVHRESQLQALRDEIEAYETDTEVSD